MTRQTILALMVGTLLATPLRANDESTKILLIGKDRDHPPRTHEYMHWCEMLAKCLTQTPGVEAVVSNGWPTDPDVLEGVDAIVLYTANGGDVLFDANHHEQAEQLLKDGVGIVALHWGTAAAEGEVGEKWLKTMGGWFNPAFSEIPVRDSVIRRADPEHPIARGWEDSPLRDEYYIKLRYLPEAHPVVLAEIDGTDYAVGWVYERPEGGRSFGFVCGHFHECFENDAFRQATVNGILWSAGCEVPESGAPCEISDEDMILPPDPRADD